MREISITKEEAGQRLDKFLGKYFREAGSSFLYKMLRKKNIVLNRKRACGREMLAEGDRIEVFFSEETFGKMRGGDVQRQLFAFLRHVGSQHVHPIYEDADILVLNKPADCLSQKTRPGEITLNEEMVSYLIASGSLTEDSFCLFHPSVSNRLDRNTTGLILAGKTLRGQQYLSDQIRDRSARKIYHAIVKGRVTKAMEISAYLYKDERENRVRIADRKEELPDGSHEIRTAYRPLAHGNHVTLLELDLLTGRSHQLRAHLASIGHPIGGDPKYGDRNLNRELREKYGIRHQLLHAYSIRLADGREFVCPEDEIYRRIMEEE